MTWRSKLSFGLGGFGQDLVYAIVSTYLMKYMTDVQLVDPMFVAVLSIFCMVVYKRGYRLTDEFDSRTGHQTKLLIFFDDALKIRSFFITLFASTTIVPHF